MRYTVLVALFAVTTTSVFAGKLPLMPSTEASVSKKPKLGSNVGDDGVAATALESLKMRKR